jgi:hypothetical protein
LRTWFENGSDQDFCLASFFGGAESAGRPGEHAVTAVEMPVPALRALLPVVGKLLLRIPFREVLFFVVLLVIPGENYPFSNFPMYSSLDDESFYFVVKTGQGETLPFATSFRSRASYVPKALKTERRKLEKEGLSSEAALNQAGHNVLNHLLEKAEPQSRDELVRSGLKLVEVRIWVANARLEQSENIVAEMPPR